MRPGAGFESYPLRRYLFDKSRGRSRDYIPHIYEVDTGEFAPVAGTDVNVPVDIDTDAPFLWLYTMGDVQAPTAGDHSVVLRQAFPATVDVRIGGIGGRGLGRTAIPFDVLAARRPQPHVLPVPYMLAPGSQLFVVFTPDVAGAFNPIRLWLQFIGLKVYGWGRK